jgi:hypothetical protein
MRRMSGAWWAPWVWRRRAECQVPYVRGRMTSRGANVPSAGDEWGIRGEVTGKARPVGRRAQLPPPGVSQLAAGIPMMGGRHRGPLPTWGPPSSQGRAFEVASSPPEPRVREVPTVAGGGDRRTRLRRQVAGSGGRYGRCTAARDGGGVDDSGGWPGTRGVARGHGGTGRRRAREGRTTGRTRGVRGVRTAPTIPTVRSSRGACGSRGPRGAR